MSIKYLLAILIFSVTEIASQTINRHEYNLFMAYANDSTSVLLINNEFPGPMIRVNLYDKIIVHVHNAIHTMEEITIHFHGILQQQTPQMDGAAFITQMPIPSGQTFTYVFIAYTAGTHMYHSHSGLQAVTAFGALIVDDPYRPWEVAEVPSGPILFSDYWKGSDRLTQEAGLLGSPFKWEGEPSDILMNGKKNYVLNLNAGQTYLLRLIGATSLSTLAFGINQHLMTVVEVDGELVVPKRNLASIEIASGQRYAVMIETRKQGGIYAMQASIRWRAATANSSCIGILKYGLQPRIITDISTLSLPFLFNETSLMLFAFLERYQTLLESQRMPSGHADVEILLYGTQEHTADGQGIHWMTNNATLDMTNLNDLTTPLLFDLYHGNEQNLPPNVVYTLKQNQLVDIVIQNTVALNGVCESHPIHIHGHKFWIHSYGVDLYNAETNIWSDKNDPVLRDSLMVYASSYAYFTANRNVSNHRKPCGWTKLRMIANNPGLWLIHCHIGAHSLMGMNVLLKENIDELKIIYLNQS